MDNSKTKAQEALIDKQQRFAEMVPKLINKAIELGFRVTIGDAYRDPRIHGEQGQKLSYSNAKSAHKFKLAIDLALFRNGEYKTKTEDHAPLGQYWQSIGGVWGGDWQDGNHYSLEHNDIK